MRVIEVTLGSGATQITPNVNSGESTPIWVSTLVLRPTTTAATLGDNTVTATKGIVIAASATLSLTFSAVRGSLLSQYYFYGTNGNVVEVLYETAQ